MIVYLDPEDYKE